MSPLVAWANAFVVTQLVEVPIYVGLAPTRVGKAFVASLLTHPIVWFVFFSPRLPLVYEEKLLLGEAFAVLAEAIFLRVGCGIATRRALGVALLANAASVAVGALGRALVGFP